MRLTLPTTKSGGIWGQQVAIPSTPEGGQHLCLLLLGNIQSLNLSQFVEDQNDLAIGQILPFWLCSRSLGLRQHTRSSRPARTPSGAESSAGTERTRGIPASSSYRGPEPRVGTASVKKTGTPPGSHARDHGHTPSSYD